MEVGTDYGTVEWTIQNISCWCAAMHYKEMKSLNFFGKTHFEIHLSTNIYGNDEQISVIMHLQSYSEVLGDLSLIGPDEHVFCSEEVDFCSKNNQSFRFRLQSIPSFADIKDRIKKKEDFLEDLIMVRFQKRSASNNVLSMKTVIRTQEFTRKIVHDEAVQIFEKSKYIDTIKFRTSNGILQSVEVYSIIERTYHSSSLHFQFLLTGQHESASIRLHVFQKKEQGDTVVRSRVGEVDLKSYKPVKETVTNAYLERHEVSNKETYILLRIRVIPRDESELQCTYVSSNENTLPIGTLSFPTSNKCDEDTSESSDSEGSEAAILSPFASSKCAEDCSEGSKACSLNQCKNSINVLSKDLMCLYQDNKFSDLSLNCDNITFPVHRAIMSARSPVFDTMLSTDMQEVASSQVDITDLDPSTLGLFLTFLYTGDIEDLRCDSALNLYYAADKYQVPSLKSECTNFLCANISMSNVCDILSLADKHKDDDLLSMSQNYILDNFNDVLGSKEWATFMEKESLLAVKTITEFAQKKHVVKKA